MSEVLTAVFAAVAVAVVATEAVVVVVVVVGDALQRHPMKEKMHHMYLTYWLEVVAKLAVVAVVDADATEQQSAAVVAAAAAVVVQRMQPDSP